MHHPNEKMLPAQEVLQTVGIRSLTTLREMIRRDDFPKPYEITRGKRHWAMSEIQAWLQQRMADQRRED
ncbi:MAG: AlpA family phage regulatory protein [Anderseniella sp.]